MEGMIKRIMKVTGSKTTVILTGGYSKAVGEYSKLVDECEPWLVLEGALIIYKMNKANWK
jgi:pantothenate kinase type III